MAELFADRMTWLQIHNACFSYPDVFRVSSNCYRYRLLAVRMLSRALIELLEGFRILGKKEEVLYMRVANRGPDRCIVWRPQQG